MSYFLDGFTDEMVKEAKYPISRVLSSLGLSSGLGAAAGGATGAASLAGYPGAPAAAKALMGASGATSGALEGLGGAFFRRILGSRAMKGRLARGGKGLMKHEKKRLAEATGLSEENLEKAIARIAKKKGGKTYPVSRALDTKYNPLNIPGRLIDARALAGRSLRGKGTIKGEQEVLEMLQKAHKGRRIEQGAKAGAGALGGLAALKAMKD